MNIAIKRILSATNAEWDHIWQGCDYSTYFHSREWAEIWENYTNGQMRPDPKLVIFTDEKKALLPLSYYRELKGLIKNYISSPAGTSGGWISTDTLNPKHAQLLVGYLTHLSSITWRLNPYEPLVHKCKLPDFQEDETHALNLESGFDAVYRLWTKVHESAARKARKARKAGVIIQKATVQNQWREYYAMYEDSLQRWGETVSSRYSWKLLEIIADQQSKNIELWLAKYEGRSIAGALCFYAKNHVVYWHGAAYSEYFELRPVNLLMYEVIKHACEHGYSWFDFNPSGGHQGVMKFKQSFGAEGLDCPVFIKVNRFQKYAQKIRHVTGL